LYYDSLEWGIGGGVKARCLCQMFNRFYSIEISKANIIETQKQLKLMGIYNFKNNLISVENPNDALKKIGKNKIDFILCAAVFQHMASKDYVFNVLKIMNKMMGVVILRVKIIIIMKIFYHLLLLEQKNLKIFLFKIIMK
jgi:2-polyprenyl-3-methyl-5-hydroxy-6-metoxy-1,4-benzoquinol methylase